MTAIPDEVKWLFWEVDAASFEVTQHADYILARILEFGGFAEVRWAMATFGLARIHRFFREVGHADISERTFRFWRAFFKADHESWARPPAWRQSSSAPWID
ncbi:MAG: hypothetical protein HYV63_24580 [Candidatus Schekmanbacteria bacterium]|nr:hypothetical protein [Candidatus Schekmanbacteria bacterium]